ncbi:MAG: hypothetical protein QM734_14480 [Cyclobacteriaceae bacterium]
MKLSLYFISLLVCVLIPSILHSQNLEQLGLKNGVKMGGSVNFSSVSYLALGIPQRRDPFNWFLTGSLNLNLFGYSAPFSFSYSNVNSSYSQPFNQVSFAPQYKWVKTYIGFNSMTFSRYTLAGHVFFGGGIELTPGKWRVSAMYGRLKQAVPYSLTDTAQNYRASYKRIGCGLKLGYEENGNALHVTIFTAKDDPNSIPFTLPNPSLTPMQNIVIGAQGKKRFLKRFFVDVEYAVSVLNHDIRANSKGDSTGIKSSSNFIQRLLPENSTSRYYDAVNASLGYQANWYTIQFKYERVAPEYQTLGAYFFNNDLQNFTVAPMLKMLKGKLNIAANIGLQNNNLDNSRASTTARTVSASNINFVPNEKWSFTNSYSNFSSYTKVKRYNDPYFQNKLDTLNFYQISKSLNSTIMRMLGAKINPQSILLNISFQNADDRASNTRTTQKSDFTSTNVSYSYGFTPSNLTMAISGNFYKTYASGIGTIFWGPSLTVTKSLFEKTLRMSMTTTYNQTETSGVSKTASILNGRINMNYSPKSKSSSGRQSLSLAVNTTRKFNGASNQSAFTEITATLNYTRSF